MITYNLHKLNYKYFFRSTFEYHDHKEKLKNPKMNEQNENSASQHDQIKLFGDILHSHILEILQRQKTLERHLKNVADAILFFLAFQLRKCVSFYSIQIEKVGLFRV